MRRLWQFLEASRQRLIRGESPWYAIYISIFVGAIIFFVLPPLLTCESISILNFKDTGEIGDTIGGITGPVIAFVAALLTFLAFWVQYQSNIAQKEQFEKQDTDVRRQRFENKFYELLKLHRDNVEEINIANEEFKRRAFIKMFHELKCCYLILHKVYRENLRLGIINKTLSEDDLINLAYMTFFLGIGDNSDKSTAFLLQDYPEALIANYIEALKRAKRFWVDHNHVTVEYPDSVLPPFTSYFKYPPFDGHMSRLGHYYRNLFQIVKFVISQDESVIENKREYLKTLRAQLSSHEQLLLYYNGLSKFGSPWIASNYFTDYAMIKNMPVPLADFGVLPHDKLGKKNSSGEFIFEWDELVNG